MKTIKTLIAVAAAFSLIGCGGGGTTTTYTLVKKAPPPVTLAGTNGDVSKYLGIWTSNCGTNFLKGTSAVNTFNLTSVSSNTVTGTLHVEEYKSLFCDSGTRITFPSLPPQPVQLTYQSNMIVDNTDSNETVFSGSADTVVLKLIGATETSTYNLGFLEDFTKFTLNSSGKFSSSDLTYTKSK